MKSNDHRVHELIAKQLKERKELVDRLIKEGKLDKFGRVPRKDSK